MTGRDAGEPAWNDYLAAAQRLDAVRRGAASLAAEQERVRRSARDELAAAEARLAPQRARLRELGIADDRLVPTPDEAAAAAQAVATEPATVLAALRQARMTADAADAAVVNPRAFALPGARRPGGAPPWLRNMLVYGPFGLVVLVVQLALVLTAGEGSFSPLAAVCGLAMPAAAFGLGWLVVGLVFPPDPAGKVQRTPLAGAVACFGPVLVTCAGIAATALTR
jgi:hypothetical protein